MAGVALPMVMPVGEKLVRCDVSLVSPPISEYLAVLRDGFDWQGRKFKSLSAVARAITGTQWNGYRFFGLREAGRDPR
jgi:hypothetical protein